MIHQDIRGSASFTKDGKHRLQLDRWWGGGPRALVCMANPSAAGADVNDPTIHSLIRLLRPICNGFTVVNEETYIATSPLDLKRWRLDMISQDWKELCRGRMANVRRIAGLSKTAHIRIAAWGDLGGEGLHSGRVLAALSLGRDIYCFGTTAHSNPKHPIARGRSRIPDGFEPIIWRSGT